MRARWVFPYKWPFTLDVLYRQYQVNKTQRLLAFQTTYFEKLGPTIEFRLFGDVGFFAFDPENIEAILSTHFEGRLCVSRSLISDVRPYSYVQTTAWARGVMLCARS